MTRAKEIQLMLLPVTAFAFIMLGSWMDDMPRGARMTIAGLFALWLLYLLIFLPSLITDKNP